LSSHSTGRCWRGHRKSKAKPHSLSINISLVWHSSSRCSISLSPPSESSSLSSASDSSQPSSASSNPCLNLSPRYAIRPASKPSSCVANALLSTPNAISYRPRYLIIYNTTHLTNLCEMDIRPLRGTGVLWLFPNHQFGLQIQGRSARSLGLL